MRRAVIDIGTNTVKLLVADVQDGKVVPVMSKDQTTRLGEGVNESKHLSRIAIARTVEAIDHFIADAREFGAPEIIALATSAARDAANCDEFLRAVRSKCGLDVQVISCEREAELIFRGVSSDPGWSSQPILVLDVGGGSAEFIQGERGNIERFQSLPLGAVRLTEQYGEDFAGLVGFLRETLHKSLAVYSVQNRRMIGTGGTITTLARIERGTLDRVSISQEELRALVARLNSLPLAERKKVPGLPPERADIIVAGGAVFLVAMELLGAFELTVSVRSLRHGALLSA
jgi:exopolyphosphatase/guanosine-5'-triphosphate,3'-diphosphate pyrophosphatase